MRTVVTVIAALVAVLTVAPGAVAQTPAATVTVTQFDCESVTVPMMRPVSCAANQVAGDCSSA